MLWTTFELSCLDQAKHVVDVFVAGVFVVCAYFYE